MPSKPLRLVALGLADLGGSAGLVDWAKSSGRLQVQGSRDLRAEWTGLRAQEVQKGKGLGQSSRRSSRTRRVWVTHTGREEKKDGRRVSDGDVASDAGGNGYDKSRKQGAEGSTNVNE